MEGEGVDVGDFFEGFLDRFAAAVAGGGFDSDEAGGRAGLHGLEPGGELE